MRLHWQTLNRLLIAGSLAICGWAWAFPGSLSEWIVRLSQPTETGLKVASSAVSPKSQRSGTEDLALSISDAEIAQASQVRLQRMQPPKPAPKIEAPPPAPVVAVPKPAELFRGSLIGIIQDSDPKFSYAILKWPEGRIQLIARGESISSLGNAPRIEEINAHSVVLGQGAAKQTLELPGEKR
ncbi:MAG: hypothetical protein ABL921_30790 [Pirellula sp.]